MIFWAPLLSTNSLLMKRPSGCTHFRPLGAVSSTSMLNLVFLVCGVREKPRKNPAGSSLWVRDWERMPQGRSKSDILYQCHVLPFSLLRSDKQLHKAGSLRLLRKKATLLPIRKWALCPSSTAVTASAAPAKQPMRDGGSSRTRTFFPF